MRVCRKGAHAWCRRSTLIKHQHAKRAQRRDMPGNVSIGRILRDLPVMPAAQPKIDCRLSGPWCGEAQSVSSSGGGVMREFLTYMGEALGLALALSTIFLIFIALGA